MQARALLLLLRVALAARPADLLQQLLRLVDEHVTNVLVSDCAQPRRSDGESARHAIRNRA
eukprot:2816226-Rhodomonas_salina.1